MKPWLFAIDPAALMGVQGGAIGVEDAWVGIESRRLTGQRHLDGLFRLQGPVMIKVEIGNLAGHQRRIGQACTLILGGMLGNGQGGRHGLANRFGAAG